jgi:hypothetical protein
VSLLENRLFSPNPYSPPNIPLPYLIDTVLLIYKHDTFPRCFFTYFM